MSPHDTTVRYVALISRVAFTPTIIQTPTPRNVDIGACLMSSV